MRAYRFGLLMVLAGCGASSDDGEVEACITENPPAEPFDVGSTEGQAQPAPEPGGTPIILPPPTAEDIAGICRDQGGTDCDAGSFISKDAANCIASERGLAQGQRPWVISLNYYGNHQRVGWGILTVNQSSSDGYSGESMVLDAVTGVELARTYYEATP